MPPQLVPSLPSVPGPVTQLTSTSQSERKEECMARFALLPFVIASYLLYHNDWIFCSWWASLSAMAMFGVLLDLRRYKFEMDRGDALLQGPGGLPQRAISISSLTAVKECKQCKRLKKRRSFLEYAYAFSIIWGGFLLYQSEWVKTGWITGLLGFYTLGIPLEGSKLPPRLVAEGPANGSEENSGFRRNVEEVKDLEAGNSHSETDPGTKAPFDPSVLASPSDQPLQIPSQAAVLPLSSSASTIPGGEKCKCEPLGGLILLSLYFAGSAFIAYDDKSPLHGMSLHCLFASACFLMIFFIDRKFRQSLWQSHENRCANMVNMVREKHLEAGQPEREVGSKDLITV